ncbi:hypothetical protein SLU01_19360 [Sporosarcina luteola]|uniref:Phage protein n=1 Tax=Sporosarcina luteola TaxID=582850 RepID=A0A511Z880_9BACL|nr:hypothetical protein [Sporosarcina luteola]GEN83624.1 hypothetical protein SLU01_19360 [Sporosarcina luteola]
MNFKDLIEDDLKTFVNPDEFGEPAIIEGESVIVVPDADKMKERQLAKGLEGELHNEELLFYVEKSQLSFYPRPDNTAVIDGVKWRITDVQEDAGLFTITVELISG